MAVRLRRCRVNSKKRPRNDERRPAPLRARRGYARAGQVGGLLRCPLLGSLRLSSEEDGPKAVRDADEHHGLGTSEPCRIEGEL